MKLFTRPGWRNELRAAASLPPAAPSPQQLRELAAAAASDARLMLAHERAAARVISFNGDRSAALAEKSWRSRNPGLAALIDSVAVSGD